MWSRMTFTPPVEQQCEASSCSYAFHSEVPSQTRPLRLQLLITAGQLSRLGGESRGKKSAQLVKQKTQSWTPVPPGDRCACGVLFIFCMPQTLTCGFASVGRT